MSLKRLLYDIITKYGVFSLHNEIMYLEDARASARNNLKEKTMRETHHLTALIEKEGDWYVALCPELDIASQGETIEDAKAMLSEAVELFFETASKEEIGERLHTGVYITPLEVTVG